MSNYGVTDKGFVRKRYDVIYKEMQEEISSAIGIDIAQNPKSLLNVLLSAVCDRNAKLWELAEDVYYSHYPSSAEGINLDYACQFGGLTREEDSRTKYTVLCTGTDGTSIPTGTRIASKTTPQIFFATFGDYEISRSKFNKAVVKVVTVSGETYYSVTLNDEAYSYLSAPNDTDEDIVKGLENSIDDSDFTVTTDGNKLVIEAINERTNHSLTLSSNLTTAEVSSLIIFDSEEFGEVSFPKGAISVVVSTVAGFSKCSNLDSPVFGRLRETDAEFRQSYIQKSASRSTSMLESIQSAILENVDGVKSATVYENATGSFDAYGRPPHSVEAVVDCDPMLDTEVARQIFNTKAAGIQTFGEVEIEIPGLYNDTITVRFNRPEPYYVWLKVDCTINNRQAIAPNAEQLIKDTILGCVENIGAGESVFPQHFISSINSVVTGLAYIEIKAYATTDSSYTPTDEEYTLTFVEVATRQKANFAEEHIKISGV